MLPSNKQFARIPIMDREEMAQLTGNNPLGMVLGSIDKLIVRAVNNHQALLEALAECFYQFEHNGDESPEDAAVLNRAKAAIDKATQ